MIEKRFKWLINLRWIAACGVITAAVLIDKIFLFNLPLQSFYIIAALLLASNLLYLFLYKKAAINPEKKFIRQQKLVVVQIITDLILLTILLHFSGGVENPFIIYYVFHMMLASILLKPITSFLLTTFGITLVGIMAIGEYAGWLPHYSLMGFISEGYYNNINYLKGSGFVFVTTSYVVVYMTSTVANMLRKRENAYREANQALQEKDDIKDEYVFRITHDIKGHLAAIKTCLDASMANLPAEERKKFLERAYSRNDKLLAFIQELLRITQLRLNKQMVYAPFSLKEVTEDLIATHADQARELQVTLKTSIEQDEMNGDKLSITEAIENLVTNSLKYTNPGGTITISSKQTTNNEIEIAVTDSGIGISATDKKKVFREFYKATNNKGRVKDGTGMGLAIVRIIVENHKGSVKVKSIEGEGASFILTFPVP